MGKTRDDKDKLDLYIRQGHAYLQLLESTNAAKNSKKMKAINQKLQKAAQKLSQLA